MESTPDIQINNDHISFQGNLISFFTKRVEQTEEYFTIQDIAIEETDCGWTFRLPATDSPQILGIMIPVGPLDVMIDTAPLDLYKSKKYYYSSPSREIERILQLNIHDLNNLEIPVVHMIDDDRAFAWSCPNECLISSFVHLHRWHINFEAITWENNLTFFLDKSTNALVNLQRYPHKPKEILINETTSLKTMQKALLAGAQPRSHPNHPHPLVREARQIQLELKKRHLHSVIIGSLARRLNSVPVDVDDIDIMVETKEKMSGAIDVLESFADRISLHDFHAKFEHQDYTIDVCYDNYNILSGAGHVISRHGLTYLGTEGLLWLYMINLFACEMNEHSDDYKDHVINAITSLHRTHKLGEFDLIPYGSVIPDYSQKCTDLCSLLSDTEMEYRDIRINKPFLVRPFKKDNEFFYVIANQGSLCDAELIIDQIPETVTWEDIAGNKATITPTAHQTFSVVRIPQISVPGILRCQRLQ